MPKSKKRAASDSESASSSDSSSSEDRSSKKKSAAKKAPEKKAKSSADEEKSFSLDSRKMIKVREFKGKLYIDIREYYEKDGDLLPGKKGVALSVDAWNKLKDVISDVDEELSKH